MNIWKIIYLNCQEICEFMIDHRSYTQNLSSCEIKAWKISGLNGIRTHDLCDTGAVLYQLSYQAIWELVTLWVRNIPVEVKDVNEYMKDHIFELQRKIWIYDWSLQLHTQLKQKKFRPERDSNLWPLQYRCSAHNCNCLDQIGCTSKKLPGTSQVHWNKL